MNKTYQYSLYHLTISLVVALAFLLPPVGASAVSSVGLVNPVPGQINNGIINPIPGQINADEHYRLNRSVNASELLTDFMNPGIVGLNFWNPGVSRIDVRVYTAAAEGFEDNRQRILYWAYLDHEASEPEQQGYMLSQTWFQATGTSDFDLGAVPSFLTGHVNVDSRETKQLMNWYNFDTPQQKWRGRWALNLHTDNSVGWAENGGVTTDLNYSEEVSEYCSHFYNRVAFGLLNWGKYLGNIAIDIFRSSNLDPDYPHSPEGLARRECTVFGRNCEQYQDEFWHEFYCDRLDRDDLIIPVTVEIAITDATFIEAHIPGVGVITSSDAGIVGTPDTSVTLLSGGHTIRHISYQESSDLEKDLSGLRIPVGEPLTVRIATTDVPGENLSISGLHDLTIQRFAGESFYHVNPSIDFGGYTPFLGFDSQVHGTVIRPWPTGNGWQPRYPELEQSGANHVEVTWVPKLPMRATADAGPLYAWCKTKFRDGNLRNLGYNPCDHPQLVTATNTQRNSQREGLNMELLHNWRNWSLLNGFASNYGDTYVYGGAGSNPTPRYIAGLDPDELVTIPTSSGGVLKFRLSDGYEVWKDVPGAEGESSLNEMISAYQAHRSWADFGTTNVPLYRGYEYQALGVGPMSPTGTDSGWTAVPGQITITQGSRVLDLAISAEPRLENSLGFYGSISGPDHIALYEEDVTYTLHGVPFNEQGHYPYKLELVYENHLGVIERTVVEMPDGIVSAESFTGDFSAEFDFKGWGYYDLTAYYQNAANEWIPVAGKEILDVSVRFIGENNILSEGRGDGAYIYLNDYFDSRPQDIQTFARSGRHASRYVREYVFRTGDQTNWGVLDSDPHTFVHDGTEWYISERLQAKRVDYDEQVQDLKFEVYRIATSGTPVTTPDHTAWGNNFEYTWDVPGDYELRVTYRDTSQMFYRVSVRNAGCDVCEGLIEVSDLTAEERAWLGVGANTNLRAYEVVDVFSKYTYIDGLRADPPAANGVNLINRFEASQNYSGQYRWDMEDPTTGNTVPVAQDAVVTQFLSNQAQGANGIASSWMPSYWIRHYSETPYPSDVMANQVIATAGVTDPGVIAALDMAFAQSQRFPDPMNDPSGFRVAPVINEEWTLRLPWVSLTDTEAYRVRTNIKAFYDMEAFFDPVGGAFAGNAEPLDQEILLRLMSDDEKRRMQFWADLNTGRKLIVDVSNYGVNAGSAGILTAYNVADWTSSEVEIATRAVFSSGNGL